MFAFYHDYSLEQSLTRTGYELPRRESFPCTYGSLVYFNFPSENVGIIPLCFRKWVHARLLYLVRQITFSAPVCGCFTACNLSDTWVALYDKTSFFSTRP